MEATKRRAIRPRPACARHHDDVPPRCALGIPCVPARARLVRAQHPRHRCQKEAPEHRPRFADGSGTGAYARRRPRADARRERQLAPSPMTNPADQSASQMRQPCRATSSSQHSRQSSSQQRRRRRRRSLLNRWRKELRRQRLPRRRTRASRPSPGASAAATRPGRVRRRASKAPHACSSRPPSARRVLCSRRSVCARALPRSRSPPFCALPPRRHGSCVPAQTAADAQNQCVEIAKSRSYGCSARWAQCGGTDPGKSTAWSGPYCCPVRRLRRSRGCGSARAAALHCCCAAAALPPSILTAPLSRSPPSVWP